jgi:hypothetical protein
MSSGRARAGSRSGARGELAGFASLRQLIDGSAAVRRLREHGRQLGLRQAWRRAVGEAFRRRELLAALRAEPGYEHLVDIVFRQGSLEGRAEGQLKSPN